ncbi:hypothetical protein ETB97_004256 [Aspergillus alliaceus]|uniref:Uncharacterized protein n=1 Tax=Petromyces alliaceus TaxID=209559 RepID=A0A5N7BTP1_PETAA|nr:hypothetical protein BDV23DRAFT_188505 [Aspergillus alliaceus]KAF5858572.1 hypothetical protein ETB97_004256 [Aspergillus burnettii]
MNLRGYLSRTRGGEAFKDRIEVANIADSGNERPNITLLSVGPLLKSQYDNLNATLIMLFLNATRDVCTAEDQLASIPRAVQMIEMFMPLDAERARGQDKSNADTVNCISAMNIFMDNDALFSRLVERSRLKETGHTLVWE